MITRSLGSKTLTQSSGSGSLFFCLSCLFDSLREVLASDEFQKDLLHQPFNSFEDFAEFVVNDLNQYFSWFFKAPQSGNFFPERGDFLRKHIPVILGEYLSSNEVEKGISSTIEIGDSKAEEMVFSPQSSPTPHTSPIFFPPFSIFEDQQKANHSGSEDFASNGGPAKRVMVELAALERRSQPLLLNLNLPQPALSSKTFEDTRMRRSSHAPESVSRRSGGSRQRNLTG